MSDTMIFPSSQRASEAQPGNYENISKNDLAIINAKYDRKKFIAALDAGTLACLPDSNGLADTQAACNVINRTTYRGSGQLLLKDFQKQNEFPTAEFCTGDQIEKASGFAGKKIYIKKGARGITLNFSINGEQTSARLFNIAQVHNPDLIRAYAEHRAQERETYLQEKYGENYRPKMNEPDKPAVSCTSSDPDVYLGQYLAAVTDGRQFKVSPRLAEEFKQKTKDFIFEKNPAGHINPFNLNRLGSKASSLCRQILPEIRETPKPEIEGKPKKEPHRPSSKKADPSMER
ncbi:MAG: ssDNA-binding domain-containing protein [Treponema sp.]|nr:ssDNA-binding domain-containing protein [Treponema sp.]